MAGADASIYSWIRPAPPVDLGPPPFEQFGAMMKLRAMGNAAKLSDLQLQDAEEARTRRQRSMEMLRNFTVDQPVYGEQEGPVRPGEARGVVQTGTKKGLNLPAYRDALYGEGFVNEGLAIDKSLRDARKEELGLQHTQAQIADLVSKSNERDLNAMQTRWKAMISAGQPALMAFRQAKASGLPDADALARAEAIKEEGLRQLVEQRIITPQHYQQAMSGRFDPVRTEQTLNSLIGWDKLIDNERQERAQRSTETHQRAMEDLRRGEIDRADGRAREAAEAGRVPLGYRRKPDGSLEAIPGGPADIGKALPHPAVRDLSTAGAAVEDTRRLTGSFKPEFGGKTLLGDMSNTIGRLTGDSSGQAQWWQDMDALQNRTRHELFGSALTKTELAAWEKTSVTPRMNADQIRQNLERRMEIEARAASKLARAYESAGYNKNQIRELLGSAAEYLQAAAPPVRPTASAQPSASEPKRAPGQRIEALFDGVPDPARYKGRVGEIDGVTYRSDGVRWVRERR